MLTMFARDMLNGKVTTIVAVEKIGVPIEAKIRSCLTFIYDGFPVNWEIVIEREDQNISAFRIVDSLTESHRIAGYVDVDPKQIIL